MNRLNWSRQASCYKDFEALTIKSSWFTQAYGRGEELANKSQSTIWVFGGRSEIASEYLRERANQGFDVVRMLRSKAGSDSELDRLWDPKNVEETVKFVDDLPIHRGDELIIANGYLGPYGGWDQILRANNNEFESMITANLTAPLVALIRGAQKLASQGGGKIILLSSLAAHPVLEINPLYGHMKLHLDNLAIGLLKSSVLKKSGVKVVIARIGFIGTKINSGRANGGFETTGQRVAKRIAATQSGIVWCPRKGRLAPLILVLPGAKKLASYILKFRWGG